MEESWAVIPLGFCIGWEFSSPLLLVCPPLGCMDVTFVWHPPPFPHVVDVDDIVAYRGDFVNESGTISVDGSRGEDGVEDTPDEQ